MKGISNPILPALRKVTQVLQVSAASQPSHSPDPHSGEEEERDTRILPLQDVMCLPKAMSPCWTTATLTRARARAGEVCSRTGMLAVCLHHPSPAGLATSLR